MKRLLVYILAFVMIINTAAVVSVSAQLPDGGEIKTENYTVLSGNNFKSMIDAGLAPTTKNSLSGMYSGLWQRLDTEAGRRIVFKNVPNDVSGYATLDFDIYLEKSYPGKSVIVTLESPSSAAGACYYIYIIQLSWSGWKHFSLTLGDTEEADMTKTRTPDLKNITQLVFVGNRWGGQAEADPESKLYFGNIYFVPSEKTDDSIKIFDSEIMSRYNSEVKDTVSVYADTKNVQLNGERRYMSDKTVSKDGVLYVPRSLFGGILKNTPKTDSVDIDGVEYINAEAEFKAEGKDVYLKNNFLIAGKNVAAFRDTNDLYRYAAYTTAYSSADELEYTDEDFDKICEAWAQNIAGCHDDWARTDDENVKTYLKNIEYRASESAKSMTEDNLWGGEFSEISLRSSSYYSNILNMAKGWYTEGTSTYHDPALKSKIIKALDWQYENTYGRDIADNGEYVPYFSWNNENWYYWDIALPTSLLNTLMLMRSELSDEQISKYLSPVNVSDKEVFSIGSNRTDVANVVIGSGALEKNAERVVNGRDAIAAECAYTKIRTTKYGTVQDGIYEDGSYLQHYGHAYTFGYGIAFLTSIMNSVQNLNGTAFDVFDPDKDNVFEWFTNNYYPLVYKGNAFGMLSGRQLSANTESDFAKKILDCMLKYTLSLDGEKAEAMKGMIKYFANNSWYNANNDFYQKNLSIVSLKLYDEILKDDTIKEISPGEFSKFYYNMGRFVTQRDNYAFGLALSSKKIKIWEGFMGQNLKGWHMGEGMTYFYVDGLKNYDNLFSYCDHSKMPGTTVDTTERTEEEYRGDAATNQQLAKNDFMGGTSIGDIYGTAAMQFYGFENDGSQGLKVYTSTLEAKKSYFAFDDEVVMLGTDINSADDKDVYTVIDNREMTGEKPINENEVDNRIKVSNVMASSNDGNVESNVIDGDFASRWSAAGEQWITLDLGEEKNIAGLRIAFYSGDKRSTSFEILTSADNEAWTEIYKGQSGGNDMFEPFEAHADNVRYIKLNCHGNNTSYWNSISEIEVIAPDADGKFTPKEIEVLRGTENVYVDGNIQSGIEYENTLDGVKYANFADKLGYCLLQSENVTVKKTNDRYPFMTLCINHGKNPKNASYAYVVLPNKTNEQTAEYYKNPQVEVIRNDKTAQIVRDKVNNVTGYVFWEAADNVNGISVKQPCIVMTRDTGDAIEVSVTEPTRLSKELALSLDNGGYTVAEADPEISVAFNGHTDINVKLPDNDNGKTYRLKLKK